MSFNYAKSVATAQRLIARFGFTATLRKEGVKSGPANNPTWGPPSEHQITVVDTSERIRDQDGRLVGQTMRTLLVSATGEVPSDDDKIIIAGKTHEISEVRPLAPGGVSVLYEVDLKT